MRLPRSVREKIVEVLMQRLQQLFDSYEETGSGVTYFTMVTEDWSEGFGAMMTLDPARIAALKMQMEIDEMLTGPMQKKHSIEITEPDPPPERN